MTEGHKADTDLLWVGLGIGVFSVASCFALAMYLSLNSAGNEMTADEPVPAAAE